MWQGRGGLSSSTANIVFGNGSRTVPSTSIASFFGQRAPLVVPAHGAHRPEPTHERVAYQLWPVPATTGSGSQPGEDLRAVLGEAIESSKWAATDLSRVTTVQPSASVLTSALPG